MYAGPDAMDWEDDVDMYGGASSTSAAVIVDPETPSGPTEKKQEARRMKEQAASDRWEHMTAWPANKLPELFGKYILGREINGSLPSHLSRYYLTSFMFVYV